MVKKEKYVVARVQQLLDMFIDEDYVEYKTALKEAVSVQPSIRGRKVKIIGKDQRKATAYILPICKNTATEIARLGEEYRASAAEYAKTRDTSALDNMDMAMLEMDALTYYDILVNEKTNTKIQTLRDKRDNLTTSIKESRDDIEHVLELQQELGQVIERIRTWEEKTPIDYFIEELPQQTTIAEADAKPKAKKKRSSESGAKDQEAPPPVVERILKTSFPFNKLPVKMVSKEECMTRSTKKPYYISLEDLRKAIEADDELKQIFGPGYKKMTKDKLCDVIFPQKKWLVYKNKLVYNNNTTFSLCLQAQAL